MNLVLVADKPEAVPHVAKVLFPSQRQPHRQDNTFAHSSQKALLLWVETNSVTLIICLTLSWSF